MRCPSRCWAERLPERCEAMAKRFPLSLLSVLWRRRRKQARRLQTARGKTRNTSAKLVTANGRARKNERKQAERIQPKTSSRSVTAAVHVRKNIKQPTASPTAELNERSAEIQMAVLSALVRSRDIARHDDADKSISVRRPTTPLDMTTLPCNKNRIIRTIVHRIL